MFTSISWQEYFSTIATIIASYYAITTLLLYSREITNIFKLTKSDHTSLGTKENLHDSNEPNQLMGDVRYEHSSQQPVTQEILEAEELRVTASQHEEEPLRIVDETAERLKSDFTKIEGEIKSLAEIIPLGTKEEAISLFKTLLSNYPQFNDTPFQPHIAQCIYDSCKQTNAYQFDPQEINTWWATP